MSHNQRLLRLMGQLAGAFFVVGFLAGGVPWLGLIGTGGKSGVQQAIADAVFVGAMAAIGGLVLAVPLAFIIGSIPPLRRRRKAAAGQQSVAFHV